MWTLPRTLLAAVVVIAIPIAASAQSHLSKQIDFNADVTAVTRGEAAFALLDPVSAVRARAAGAPIKAVYMIDGRYVVANEKLINASGDTLATTLRELARQPNGSAPGPAQTAALSATAAGLAASDPSLSRVALREAATTLVDRAPARRALAQSIQLDPRCGTFCDQW
jgi:hypothetical protein